ncbi:MULTISPECIES: GNAT family N-acetyltransferase [Bacillus]|uniref:GNAT family N-acetyltransferase n=1 Tax=Bacillus TaxID=1386 RepID=UPI000BB8D447|nr:MULTISPECIES: GNAT family N-acetyltransferase [Bacillus]
MDNRICTRRATLADWEELWPLLKEIGKTDSEENTKERFELIVTNTAYFLPVAIYDGKIVGYTWVQTYGPHLRSGEITSRIHDMFVLEPYRKSGVGKILMETIKDWAISTNTKWLQWNSSPKAVEFYKRLGLESIEEDPNYPLFEIEFLKE